MAGEERIQQLLKYVFSVIGRGAPPPRETGPYYVPQPRRHPKTPGYGMDEREGVTTGAFGGGMPERDRAIGRAMAGPDAYRPGFTAKTPRTGVGATPSMPRGPIGKIYPVDAPDIKQGLPLSGPGEVNDPKYKQLNDPRYQQEAYDEYQRATGGKLDKWSMGSGGLTGVYDPVLGTYTSAPGREAYQPGTPEAEKAKELYELTGAKGAAIQKELERKSKERAAEIEAGGRVGAASVAGGFTQINEAYKTATGMDKAWLAYFGNKLQAGALLSPEEEGMLKRLLKKRDEEEERPESRGRVWTGGEEGGGGEPE